MKVDDGTAYADFEIAYGADDLCLLQIEVSRDSGWLRTDSEYVWWVFGRDLAREAGMLGIPRGDRRPASLTREGILSALNLDRWEPLADGTNLDDCTRRRLQGNITVWRQDPEDFLTAINEINEGPNGTTYGWDLLESNRKRAETRIGAHNVHVRDVTPIPPYQGLDKREQPVYRRDGTLGRVLYFPGERDVGLVSHLYDRDSVTLPAGVYRFGSLCPTRKPWCDFFKTQRKCEAHSSSVKESRDSDRTPSLPKKQLKSMLTIF